LLVTSTGWVENLWQLTNNQQPAASNYQGIQRGAVAHFDGSNVASERNPFV
jgi:hypothetical protein